MAWRHRRHADGSINSAALKKVIIPGYRGSDDSKRTQHYVYWRDVWNWLDIVCVITGFLKFFDFASNMSALRVFRVMRSAPPRAPSRTTQPPALCTRTAPRALTDATAVSAGCCGRS
eukprot:SAG11_NODE_14543_length_608_cov_1.277014_1_plen_116_part_10